MRPAPPAPEAPRADEVGVSLQLSFLHGFVEYDLVEDRVLRWRTCR
jgi:hypothetical protein